MLTVSIFFAFFSSAVAIFSTLPYIRDIFRHKTTPHSYTWLVWTILQLTSVVVMLKAGAGWGVLSLGSGGLLCGIIFLLSLKYGTKNVTNFDRFCLTGSLTTIVIYFLTQNALLSVILVSLVDLIAYLPTIRKTYEEPYSETLLTYVCSIISCLLALLALSNFNLTTSLYLICLIIASSVTALIIVIRRRAIKIV